MAEGTLNIGLLKSDPHFLIRDKFEGPITFAPSLQINVKMFAKGVKTTGFHWVCNVALCRFLKLRNRELGLHLTMQNEELWIRFKFQKTGQGTGLRIILEFGFELALAKTVYCLINVDVPAQINELNTILGNIATWEPIGIYLPSSAKPRYFLAIIFIMNNKISK